MTALNGRAPAVVTCAEPGGRSLPPVICSQARKTSNPPRSRTAPPLPIISDSRGLVEVQMASAGASVKSPSKTEISIVVGQAPSPATAAEGGGATSGTLQYPGLRRRVGQVSFEAEISIVVVGPAPSPATPPRAAALHRHITPRRRSPIEVMVYALGFCSRRNA